MLFVEGKVAPTSAALIQKYKHFDQWIKLLKTEPIFHDNREHFPEDLIEEKESFQYLFSPEKYVDKTKSLQKYFFIFYSYKSNLDTTSIHWT